MSTSRKSPGFIASLALHAGLLGATLLAFADARKFEDAQEAVAVEVVSDAALNQVAKGEKNAPQTPKPAVRAVQAAAEVKPRPQEAKRDVPTPPPPLRRLAEPSADDAREKPVKEAPAPPKRVAALAPDKPAPTPPPKPQAQAKAAPEPEKPEPDDAEVVKPKPPQKPKLDKAEQEAPKPPEKPKEKPRLKVDEVAKLLKRQKEAREGTADVADKAEKTEKAAKPKSGDETAPKTRFSASSIATLLSHEAPQQAATGQKTQLASLGATSGAAPKMSPSLEGRIDAMLTEHYQQCWQNRSLTMTVRSYVPQVELHIARSGAFEAAPRLLNPSANPVERAYAEQALAALRACPPLRFPPEFLAYYDYWRVKELNMLADR